MSRRSRRYLRQSPSVTGRESTHIDTAFMGLTSSDGVTVDCKLPARRDTDQVIRGGGGRVGESFRRRRRGGGGRPPRDVSPGAAEAQVCANLGQPLTRAEWNVYVPGVPYRAPCS